MAKKQDEQAHPQADEAQSQEAPQQEEAQMDSLNGAGDTRVRVEAKVSIFGLSVGEVGYLSRTSEVEKAINSGYLTAQA